MPDLTKVFATAMNTKRANIPGHPGKEAVLTALAFDDDKGYEQLCAPAFWDMSPADAFNPVTIEIAQIDVSADQIDRAVAFAIDDKIWTVDAKQQPLSNTKRVWTFGVHLSREEKWPN